MHRKPGTFQVLPGKAKSRFDSSCQGRVPDRPVKSEPVKATSLVHNPKRLKLCSKGHRSSSIARRSAPTGRSEHSTRTPFAGQSPRCYVNHTGGQYHGYIEPDACSQLRALGPRPRTSAVLNPVDRTGHRSSGPAPLRALLGPFTETKTDSDNLPISSWVNNFQFGLDVVEKADTLCQLLQSICQRRAPITALTVSQR